MHSHKGLIAAPHNQINSPFHLQLSWLQPGPPSHEKKQSEHQGVIWVAQFQYHLPFPSSPPISPSLIAICQRIPQPASPKTYLLYHTGNNPPFSQKETTIDGKVSQNIDHTNLFCICRLFLQACSILCTCSLTLLGLLDGLNISPHTIHNLNKLMLQELMWFSRARHMKFLMKWSILNCARE